MVSAAHSDVASVASELPFIAHSALATQTSWLFLERSKTFPPQDLCIIIPITQHALSSYILTVCFLTSFLL